MTRLIVKQPVGQQQQQNQQHGSGRREGGASAGPRDSGERALAGTRTAPSSSRESENDKDLAIPKWEITSRSPTRRSPTRETQTLPLIGRGVIQPTSPTMNCSEAQQAARGVVSERRRANNEAHHHHNVAGHHQGAEIMQAAGGHTEWVAQRQPYNIEEDDLGYNSADEYEDVRGGRRRTSESWQDALREKKFEEDLWKEKGLIVKKCKEDGNCLFRAISDQVCTNVFLYVNNMYFYVSSHTCMYAGIYTRVYTQTDARRYRDQAIEKYV
jgi:hypothetical protein